MSKTPARDPSDGAHRGCLRIGTPRPAPQPRTGSLSAPGPGRPMVRPRGPFENYKTAAGYATSEQNPADAQRLGRAGFQQALVENTDGGNGISFVLQFATASDAAREQSFEAQNDTAGQGGLPFRFSVSGVPGADGFGARPVAGQGDANALFREGRCLLLVGDESAPHPKSYEAAVIAGVQAIHARTAGHDGACSG
jgi:hypothetical protein